MQVIVILLPCYADDAQIFLSFSPDDTTVSARHLQLNLHPGRSICIDSRSSDGPQKVCPTTSLLSLQVLQIYCLLGTKRDYVSESATVLSPHADDSTSVPIWSNQTLQTDQNQSSIFNKPAGSQVESLYSCLYITLLIQV